MTPLTPDEMEMLRRDMADMGYSDGELDVLIRLVDSIIISIIDQNSGRHSVQLSLAARASYAFNKHADSGAFSGISAQQIVASDSECAISRKINTNDFDQG